MKDMDADDMCGGGPQGEYRPDEEPVLIDLSDELLKKPANAERIQRLLNMYAAIVELKK